MTLSRRFRAADIGRLVFARVADDCGHGRRVRHDASATAWAPAGDGPANHRLLFVQLDGVPFPVLEWAVQSGAVPTIRRWLLSGSHVLREWTPQLPCTTPERAGHRTALT